MKRCSRCRKEKPRSEYYRNHRSSDGYSYYCKDCDRAVNKAARAKRREAFNQQRRDAYANGHTKRHVHTHAGYMTGCLKCRNAARWRAFKKFTRPIICKSGRIVPQASFAKG